MSAPLSEREVAQTVLDAMAEAAVGLAAHRPGDALVAIRFDAEGGVTIACRFARRYFSSTEELAGWLVQQRRPQPEAAPAALAA